MSNQNNGGPAFPSSENGTSHTIAMAAMLQLPENASTDEKDKIYIQTKAKAMQGMSLRDYFAAHTAITLDDYDVPYASSIVGRGMPDFAADPLGNQLFWAEFRARMRYAEADAMLAARG
ncbi:hypothetical protein YA0721_03605 [Pseudomonas carnis]|uniref:hypothetical protein n=1 Tax=Pseudomonas carnis TaxID=2487355 RepID=UPI0018E601B8|nr:hypothetical protein [Pseudomonas carnis]MBI6655003.1 hypothetical protein [Pseudomonas carnis]MBI6660135.1 hypothetical protein [Pseudomonas carnis]MBI6687140.1 hypothetical protein [Pseudomonas carnis]